MRKKRNIHWLHPLVALVTPTGCTGYAQICGKKTFFRGNYFRDPTELDKKTGYLGIPTIDILQGFNFFWSVDMVILPKFDVKKRKFSLVAPTGCTGRIHWSHWLHPLVALVAPRTQKSWKYWRCGYQNFLESHQTQYKLFLSQTKCIRCLQNWFLNERVFALSDLCTYSLKSKYIRVTRQIFPRSDRVR